MARPAAQKYRDTPLRQAQRELTRARIREAAGRLFRERHFDLVTMDQIATAAGLQRSTLYLHYGDKAQILAAIMSDYIPRARGLMSRFPGPFPSLQEVEAWMKEVVAFFLREQVALTLMREVGLHRSAGADVIGIERLLVECLEGLAQNNPAFHAAADPARPDLTARARVLLLIQSLAHVCYMDHYANDKAQAVAMQKIVCKQFHDFIHEQRMTDTGP